MKKGIQYLCTLFIMFLSCTLYSQTISGTVTDESNVPLPGVNILIKGQTQGTATDFDGHYTLNNVDQDAVLVFSFLGFETKTIEVNGKTTINITLTSESSALDEVIVVGASIKRGDLTGSVSSISAEEISEIPTPNVTQALQGRVPGVYIQQNPSPGASSSIRIRGNNSIQFGTNPIFVVDGLIIQDGFNSINPDDIASIDILKDASATAIYGSRGSNGVVVITTKKGKSGEGKISYDSWVGISKFANDVSILNAQQLFDLRVDAYANKYINDNPGADRQSYIDQITSDDSDVFADYELESYRSGSSYDWRDEVMRTGIQNNHTLSFSGGGENGSYYISGGYTDQKGTLINSGYKRYNGKINLSQDVKPWLTVGTNTTYSHSGTTYQEGSAFPNAVRANPLLPIDSEAFYLKYGAIESQDAYNPIRSLAIDDNSFKNRLLTSNFISVKPIDGIVFRSTFSADITDQANYSYIPNDTGQSLRNSYDGQANHYKAREINYQWDNTATYNTSFGKHNVDFLLGTSLTKNTNNFNQVIARGFITNDFTYKYLDAASQKENFQLSSDFVTTTLNSYIARANYNYDRKYFATLTTRIDGSSRFGDNNKWGTFPSLALAWDVSREGFFDEVNFINQLKLKAGYGIAGNQNIPNYGYVTQYRPTFTNNTITYVSDGRLGNPDLKWERQKQLNVGVELGLFKNRFTLTAEYFNIKNEDLLMVRTLPSIVGFANQVDNVGALKNKGFDINLSTDIIQTSNFRWNVSANISSAKSKVTELYDDLEAIYNQGGFTGVEIQRTGNLFLNESLNTIYVYEFDKIAQQEDMAAISNIDFGGRIVQPGDVLPVDRNNDGVINDDDRYVVGNADPKIYGGFSTQLEYKGIGLNAVFSYVEGSKRTSFLYDGFMSSSGLSQGHTDLLNRWTPTNTDTDIPRAYFGGGRYSLSETSAGIQDGSYLRLNTLTLSYNLPNSLLEKISLDRLKLYLTGSNLFTLTNYKGYDPEGGDSYPISRMIVMGLNLSL